jgi:hypothetical protein
MSIIAATRNTIMGAWFGRGALLVLGLMVCGAQACDPSPGMYCPSAVGSPAPCPPGFYCPDTTGLVKCPAGTANPLAEQQSLDACQPCGANTTAPLMGSQSCQACPMGTVYGSALACTACVAGTYSKDGVCADCGLGTMSTGGSNACSPCPPGTYYNTTGGIACTACPSSTYTYTTDGPGKFIPLWGASSHTQCLPKPGSAPLSSLACLPGTYILDSACVPCPMGYYCPTIAVYPNSPGQIRLCPEGTNTPSTGALSIADCSVPMSLLGYTLAQCAVTPGDVQALTGLDVKAMTATLDVNAVYLATSTAVYRLFMQKNTLEQLAGSLDGTPGPIADAVGYAARFTSISAIAVDLDRPAASVVVVGDGNAVRVLDVYTRQVTLLGAAGSVTMAGGIALRRDSATGMRLAYVSDAQRHCIVVFNVDKPTQAARLFAGDGDGGKGRLDANYGLGARFHVPLGLAFQERSLNASRYLLVADSGNGIIRQVDAETSTVTTWFAPKDTVVPEMVTPVYVTVAHQGDMVYVADTGRKTISAIQTPTSDDMGVRVLNDIVMEPTTTTNRLYSAVLPYGERSTGANPMLGFNSAQGFKQLIVLDAFAHSIEALLDTDIAQSDAGGGGLSACHIPGVELSPAALCGNGFLDSGETCDAPMPGSGCDPVTCTLQVNYTCPSNEATCLRPCRAYPYANAQYCEAECAALTPPPGFTINRYCELIDIDECDTGDDDDCSYDAMCINTYGAYDCECFPTYFGDGFQCAPVAYAVYSVIKVPSIPTADVLNGGAAMVQPLENAYADALSGIIPDGMPSVTAFVHRNTSQLARMYTSYSLDPAYVKGVLHMELVTLFETNELALAAADGVNQQLTLMELAARLSKAWFGQDDTDSVVLIQGPKVRQHTMVSMFTPQIQDTWGMNVTGVSYNRRCTVQNALPGWTEQPQGGCWEVEMVFVGGRRLTESHHTTLENSLLQQAKNVLYLPRIENDPVTLKPLIETQKYSMTAQFPCDVDTVAANGRGIAASATACCLRNFETKYRPSTGFAPFLNSDSFAAAVPPQVCANSLLINDTYPLSDIVYEMPTGNDTESNDLVVGKIEGMRSSEVRLLETLDYTTRAYRVLLVLEEGDLRAHASVAEGVAGVDYSMSFFVGLANFRGTTTSVLSVQNTRQYITVKKTNELTISTFGDNQDPLLTSQSMSLIRIKVTDMAFDSVPVYLYYLRVIITMNANFGTPKGGGEVIPRGSVRIIKTKGGAPISMFDTRWQQVCASSNATHVYADNGLRERVTLAQKQDCTGGDLQFCYSPSTVNGVVTFGIPLPLDFINATDFEGWDTGNPTSIHAEFLVQTQDKASSGNVLNTVSMAVRLSPLGFTSVCETRTALQTLADIIDGSIYVGTAVTEDEWNQNMQRQTEIQVPGSTPANSLAFKTVTLQGSVMTFAALGSYPYFTDPRYGGQTVNMHDIWSVSFLEPLNGVKDGDSPDFNHVKGLFFQGRAFQEVVDPMTHAIWLVPTKALLDRCPLRPKPGLLGCLTKKVSTYANSTLSRSANDVVEIGVDEKSATSIAEMKNLMVQVLRSNGDTAKQMGEGFYNKLRTKLDLNNRFRKAYVISPMVDWSASAIQYQQPGKTAYTLASRIIAIGLITLKSAAGEQLARRLLSVGLSEEDPHKQMELPLFPQRPAAEEEVKAPAARRMLQADADSSTSLVPSRTATGNSLILNVSVGGYDTTSQLCSVIDADLPFCRSIQYTFRVDQGNALSVCDAYHQGALGMLLNEHIRSILTSKAENVTESLLADFTVSGCPSPFASPAQRRLFAASMGDLVLVFVNVLIRVENGITSIDPTWLVNNNFGGLFYLNGTVKQELFGGQAIILSFTMPPLPPNHSGNTSFYGNLNITVKNATLDANYYKDKVKPGKDSSLAFITENNEELLKLKAKNAEAENAKQSAAGTTSPGAWLGIACLNALVAIALTWTCAC